MLIATYHYTFVQTHRRYKAMVSPNPVVLMMYQCRFVSNSTHTMAVGGTDNGSTSSGGRGCMGNLRTFPVSFAVNFKLL